MEWSLEERQAVIEVSVDMWGGFTKVIQEVFPNARITCKLSITAGSDSQAK